MTSECDKINSVVLGCLKRRCEYVRMCHREREREGAVKLSEYINIQLLVVEDVRTNNQPYTYFKL